MDHHCIKHQLSQYICIFPGTMTWMTDFNCVVQPQNQEWKAIQGECEFIDLWLHVITEWEFAECDVHLSLSCSNPGIQSEKIYTTSTVRVFYLYFIPDLLYRLERLRGLEKTVGEVGPTLMNWVSISMETNDWERRRENGTTHLHFLQFLFLLDYVPLHTTVTELSLCASLLLFFNVIFILSGSLRTPD